MSDFHIKRGDRLPVLEATLLDSDGKPVNLGTASNVQLRLRERGATTNALTGSCVITSTGRGEIEYRWGASDTASVGTFDGEFVVTWSDGRTQTIPSRGVLKVIISQSLA